MPPNINLLPHGKKKRVDFTLYYIVITIIVLIGSGFLAKQYFSAKSEAKYLASEQELLLKQTGRLQVELDNLLAEQTGSLEKSIGFVETITHPSSPLFMEVRDLLIDYSYLRTFNFSVETLSLVVDFETMNDLSKYVDKLERSPYFKDVKVHSVSSFNINPEQESEENLEEIPRYKAMIEGTIDLDYLMKGEDQ